MKSSDNPTTLEDYIILISFSPFIKKGDIKLFENVRAQVYKHQGLTDRQMMLMQKKVLEYKYYLEANGYFHYEAHIENTKLPLREIDRTKKIDLIAQADMYGVEIPFMSIRFPFSNRMIKHIDYIKKLEDSTFDAKTKTHFIPMNEKNVYNIVQRFKDSNFEIADKVLEFYKKVEVFAIDTDSYTPGVYNYELKNVSDRVKNWCYENFGEPDPSNIHLYLDRADELGLINFDYSVLQKHIEQKHGNTAYRFLCRTNKNVHAPTTDYALDEIIDCINLLQRWPLLIVIPPPSEFDKQYSYTNFTEVEHLSYVHTMLRPHIHNQDISVLYRKDNVSLFDKEFNNYVTREQLNSLPNIDTTKVVVISNSKKIPKPLIASGWLPKAILFLGESLFVNRSISIFKEASGLNIHYAKQILYNHTGICRL